MKFLTVTYKLEFWLQKLQARSIAKFGNAEDISSITVVINENESCEAKEIFNELVLPEYGILSDRVNIIMASEISEASSDIKPYVRQQILKVRGAAMLRAPFVTVLDSKNFFIRPFTWRDFYSPLGKPKCVIEDFSLHVLRDAPDRYLKYFNGSGKINISQIPAVMTPFSLSTTLSAGMIDHIEKYSGNSFEYEFSNKIGLESEFLLYSIWLLHCGYKLTDIFENDSASSMTLWPGYYKGADNLAIGLERAMAEDRVCIGLHLRRALEMDENEQEVLSKFLRSIGLLEKLRLTY